MKCFRHKKENGFITGFMKNKIISVSYFSEGQDACVGVSVKRLDIGAGNRDAPATHRLVRFF